MCLQTNAIARVAGVASLAWLARLAWLACLARVGGLNELARLAELGSVAGLAGLAIVARLARVTGLARLACPAALAKFTGRGVTASAIASNAQPDFDGSTRSGTLAEGGAFAEGHWSAEFTCRQPQETGEPGCFHFPAPCLWHRSLPI